jgi:hypothetical protein
LKNRKLEPYSTYEKGTSWRRGTITTPTIVRIVVEPTRTAIVRRGDIVPARDRARAIRSETMRR